MMQIKYSHIKSHNITNSTVMSDHSTSKNPCRDIRLQIIQTVSPNCIKNFQVQYAHKIFYIKQPSIPALSHLVLLSLIQCSKIRFLAAPVRTQYNLLFGHFARLVGKTRDAGSFSSFSPSIFSISDNTRAGVPISVLHLRNMSLDSSLRLEDVLILSLIFSCMALKLIERISIYLPYSLLPTATERSF